MKKVTLGLHLHNEIGQNILLALFLAQTGWN